MIETEARPVDNDEYIDPLDRWQFEQAERLARIKLALGQSINRIAPHDGRQWMFAACLAQICWYGGAAGGGKSFLLLLEIIRHIFNPLVRAVIFRRTYKQIKQPGGLWDTAQTLYAACNGSFNETGMYCTWPSGCRMNFSHMQLEKHKQDWDGSQLALALWDELFHFSESQYTYVTFSRARSLSGVVPYSRAGLNPDPGGWTRKWVDPYIGEDGWPLEEMAGRILYMYRDGNDLVWGKSPESLMERYTKIKKEVIKSFCFIPASLNDNKTLQEMDPAYAGNIESLPYVQRLRLQGNWNVKAGVGSYFQHHMFNVIDVQLNNIVAVIRHWDFAATEPDEVNTDPDWLRGGLWAITSRADLIFMDLKSARVKPGEVERIIVGTSEADRQVWGTRYTVGFEQEPASMSKILIDIYARKLRGFKTWVHRPDKNKEIRATPLASHAQNIGIYMMRGHWNAEAIEEFFQFPMAPHDDIVDTGSGAYEFFMQGKTRDLSGYA